MSFSQKLSAILHSRIFALITSIFASAVVFVSVGILVKQNIINNYTITRQSDLVSLIKPSIVKVITSTSGKVTYPDFRFNADTLELEVITPKKGMNEQTFSNDDAYGTGFIVDDSGYILTNAHVATIGILKDSFVSQLYSDAVDELETRLSKSKNPKDKALYEKYTAFSDNDWKPVYEKGYRVVWDNLDTSGVFQQIAVVDPLFDSSNFDEQIAHSFPATIVKANEEFLFDDKDIALIKIEKNNLPTISIDDETPVSEGEHIIIAGYPSSADTGTSANKASITSGIVSSLKDSENIKFKYFEVDAKVSPGSSGSPVIDSNGHVIGILTEQSDALFLAGGGDNFAYAIPINEAKEYYKDVIDNKRLYETNFKRGLAYYHYGQCKEAALNFGNAGQSDENFIKNSDIGSYLSSCKPRSAIGLIEDVGFVPFVVTFVIVLLFITSVWFWKKDIFLEAKINEEEKEIKKIEEIIQKEQIKKPEDQAPYPPQLGV